MEDDYYEDANTMLGVADACLREIGHNIPLKPNRIGSPSIDREALGRDLNDLEQRDCIRAMLMAHQSVGHEVAMANRWRPEDGIICVTCEVRSYLRNTRKKGIEQ